MGLLPWGFGGQTSPTLLLPNRAFIEVPQVAPETLHDEPHFPTLNIILHLLGTASAYSGLGHGQ